MTSLSPTARPRARRLRFSSGTHVVTYLSLVLRGIFPSLGVAGAPTCKYHPPCSQYANDALRKYGPVRGSLKAAWRLLRCNPWSHGGVDYA